MNITYEQIVELINLYGNENVQFLLQVKPLRNLYGIKYTSSSDQSYIVPYIIDVDDNARFNWSENYKFSLLPTVEGFAKENRYVDDLISSIKNGFIELKIVINHNTLKLLLNE